MVRYGVEWFAGSVWSASARTWETRREAAKEAGRVVRAFGTEARIVLLATVPVPPRRALAPAGRLTDVD